MRWFVGFLLMTAALLKAAQLYQHPSSVLTDETSRYVVPLLIGCELALGLTAILGIYWRQLRLLAMVLFAGFACYSLFLAISGAASCGCFGSLEINPWWTFSLDLAVFAGLFVEHFIGKQDPLNSPAKNFFPKVGMAGTAMLSIAVAFCLAWHVAPHQTDSQEGFQAVGNLVILEPENWIGQPLPIAAHIDIGEQLLKGDWILLLFHHDCPKCQEALPRYEQLAQAGSRKRRVAVVEVPPYGGNPGHVGVSLYGRLTDGREWFVQAPVEIELKNGIVAHASTELMFLNESAVAGYAVRDTPLHAAATADHQSKISGGAKL